MKYSPFKHDQATGSAGLQKQLVWSIVFVLALLLLWAEELPAQEGVPYISNYSPPAGLSTSNRAICQDVNGLMLFGGKNGIVSFDGYKWKSMEEDINVLTMAGDPFTGEIFLGVEAGFGYFDTTYVPLSDPNFDYGRIGKIVFTNKYIFFHSPHSITRIGRENIRQHETIWSEQEHPFAGVFLLGNELYVNIKGRGLSRFESTGLSPVESTENLEDISIVFHSKWGEDMVLLGTDNSFMYLYDGKSLTDFIPADEEYFFNAVITGAEELDKDRIAISTLTGGCVILNKKNRKTEKVINYQSGLPDDEIYSIFHDRENGIWLSHEFGASRIDLSLPLSRLDPYKGLEGNISQLIIFHDTLYVSTSEGVFYLSKVKQYQKRDVFVKTRIPVHTPSRVNSEPPNKLIKHSSVSSPEPVSPSAGGQQKKRGLRALFSGKKSKDGEQTGEKSTASKENTQSPVDTKRPSSRQSTRYRTEYIKRTNLELKSISYEFRKVEELNAKCRQFLVYRDRLLVASSTGLYHIAGHKSKYLLGGSYVYNVEPSSYSDRLYVGTESGLITLDNVFGKRKSEGQVSGLGSPVSSILETNNVLWFSSGQEVYRIALGAASPLLAPARKQSFPGKGDILISQLGSKPAFFSSTGIYHYSKKDSNFVISDSILTPGKSSLLYFKSSNDQLWLGQEDIWLKLPDMNESCSYQSSFLRLFDGIRFLYSDYKNNLWVVDRNNHLAKIRPSSDRRRASHFSVEFISVSNNKEKLDTKNKISVNRNDLPLEIELWSACYIRPDLSLFKYNIEGLDMQWQDWSNNRKISIPYLEKGDYTINISSKNVLADIASVKSIDISVVPPFTESPLFYGLILFSALALIYIIILFRESKLIKDKRVLEENVVERTREIERQKDEIQGQKNEIESQKQEITDSIEYGQRLQRAIMQQDNSLNKILPEHFVFFKPRDLVSGDFYWATRKNDKIIVAAGDCTGHGVPGAFLSFMAYSFLEEITNNYKLTTAAAYLNRLRTRFIKALGAETNEDAWDGIDMTLCIIDLDKLKLQFAGAYNPLYIIRDGNLMEISPDKMPIGSHPMDKKAFTNRKLNLHTGDMLYMFSDGFPDQFGGSKTKKYKLVPFQNLLLKISGRSLKTQRKMLKEELQEWMGDQPQVDDILVMGIKI